MQRVSGANFLANAFGAGKNGYQDYNPATGQPGTTPDASALSALQEEIASYVEAHGLVLNANDNTQLGQAIAAQIGAALLPYETIAAEAAALAAGLSTYVQLSSFGSSVAENGYQKLPSGLILQWGDAVQSGNTGGQAVSFPIAFPNGVLNAYATNRAFLGPPASFHGTGNYTATGMNVYSSNSSGVAAQAGVAFNWLAIGH